MSNPAKDSDFLAFSRQGCAEAFGRIVERNAGSVHGAAQRVLGQRAALADDVAQQVFLLLAKKGRALPETLVVGAWLQRQAVRLSLNTIRGEKRREGRERRAMELETLHTMNDQSSTEPKWREVMPHIDKAILELPKRDQEALALRFIEGRKMREIAARLGVNTNTVEKRIGRALAKLRERLVRRGVAPSVALLGAGLSKHTASAAPSALVSSITTQAAGVIESGSAHFIYSFILMTIVKSTAIGLSIGLLFGGAFIVWGSSNERLEHIENSSEVSGASSRPRIAAQSRGSSRGSAPRWEFLKPDRHAEATFSRIQGLLDQPDNEITRRQLRELLRGLPADQFSTLLILIGEGIDKPWNVRRVLGELTTVWAEVDPHGAVEGLLNSAPIPGMRPPGDLAATAFEIWAKASPSDAQTWLIKHQEDELLQGKLPEMVASVAKQLATESEEAVIDWASQIEGSALQLAALGALWASISKSHFETPHGVDVPSLIERLNRVEDQELSGLAMSQMLRDWASHRSHEFDGWLADLPPGELAYDAALTRLGLDTFLQRTSTSQDAMEAISASLIKDGEYLKFAKRALELAPGGESSEVVEEILQGSARVPWEMKDWALPLLGEGAGREAAIQAAAEKASKNSILTLSIPPGTGSFVAPPDANRQALEWVRHLEDPVVRDPLIRKYLQAFQKGNRHTARYFVENNDWPEELQAVLREEGNQE